MRPSQVAAAHSHLSVVYRTVPQAAKAVLSGGPCAGPAPEPQKTTIKTTAPVWWSQVDFITTFAGPTGNQECAGKELTSGTFSMVTDIVQTTTTETNPDNSRSTYTVRGGTAKFNLSLFT